MVTRRSALLVILFGCANNNAAARPPQTSKDIKTIGVLFPWTREDTEQNAEEFVQAMQKIGYERDVHFKLVTRMSEGRPDRLSALAEELVKLKVDLILTASTLGVLAASRATSTIPIVFFSVTDPVGGGLARSLAHPGRNITGLANVTLDLNAKRLQWLKEMVPSLTNVAYLINPSTVNTNKLVAASVQGIHDLARPFGLQVFIVKAAARDDLERAFDDMAVQRAGAFIVMQDPHLWNLRKEISQLALSRALPSMWASADSVDAGGLMSYGHDESSVMPQLAVIVDRIFNGMNAGDVPIEQPTKFELVINEKTARALKIAIPRALRLQAAKVID